MIKKFWFAVGGKKFVGLCFATSLCFAGKITGEIWAVSLLIYCGANVYQKYLGAKAGDK